MKRRSSPTESSFDRKNIIVYLIQVFLWFAVGTLQGALGTAILAGIGILILSVFTGGAAAAGLSLVPLIAAIGGVLNGITTAGNVSRRKGDVFGGQSGNVFR